MRRARARARRRPRPRCSGACSWLRVFGQSGNDAARIATYLGPNGDQAVFRAVSVRVARRRDACVAAALGAPSTGHSKRAGGRSGDGIVSDGEPLGADGALDALDLAAASRRAAWAARDLAARSGARAVRARSRCSRGGARPRRRIRPVDRRKWRRLGRHARRARSTQAATARRCSGACGACVRTRRRRASWLRGRRGDRIERYRCTSQAGTAVRRMRVQVAER